MKNDKKIKVVILDLEKKGWFRRPAAAINVDDPKIHFEYKYFILDNSEGIPINNSRLKSLRINADYVVIFAYRIPELILMQSNPAVKFVYIQHGYYPDFLKRNLFGIIKKADRAVIYMGFVLKYFLAHWRINETLDILKLWLKPGHQATSLREPNLCFVFDDYWEQFHQKKLGWKNSKYSFTKYYEPKKIKKETKYTIQYVAQTLVEDGRLDKASLIEVLNKYIHLNGVSKLCILGHPRTDESLYRDLDCEYFFEYNSCFAIPTIGHYSSLMLYLAENGVDVSIISSDRLEIPKDFYIALDRSRFDHIKRYTNDKSDTIINGVFYE